VSDEQLDQIAELMAGLPVGFFQDVLTGMSERGHLAEFASWLDRHASHGPFAEALLATADEALLRGGDPAAILAERVAALRPDRRESTT
jgi:hypothetical protein